MECQRRLSALHWSILPSPLSERQCRSGCDGMSFNRFTRDIFSTVESLILMDVRRAAQITHQANADPFVEACIPRTCQLALEDKVKVAGSRSRVCLVQ